MAIQNQFNEIAAKDPAQVIIDAAKQLSNEKANWSNGKSVEPVAEAQKKLVEAIQNAKPEDVKKAKAEIADKNDISQLSATKEILQTEIKLVKKEEGILDVKEGLDAWKNGKLSEANLKAVVEQHPGAAEAVLKQYEKDLQQNTAPKNERAEIKELKEIVNSSDYKQTIAGVMRDVGRIAVTEPDKNQPKARQEAQLDAQLDAQLTLNGLVKTHQDVAEGLSTAFENYANQNSAHPDASLVKSVAEMIKSDLSNISAEKKPETSPPPQSKTTLTPV
jgi:hypothetical protein